MLSDDSVESSPTPMTQSAQSPLSGEGESSSSIVHRLYVVVEYVGADVELLPMVIYQKWLELNKHCDLLNPVHYLLREGFLVKYSLRDITDVTCDFSISFLFEGR